MSVLYSTRVTAIDRRAGTVKSDGIVVVADVGMQPNGAGGFALTGALKVTIDGLDQAVAEEVVAKAHAVCPYSNAVKRNIDVAIVVSVT